MGFLYRKLIRSLLFNFNPETVHDAVIRAARAAQGLEALNSVVRLMARAKDLPVTVAGIKFRNPVGLAAGFDKNCEAARFLAGLGFGFLELGTVTLRPQPGNPKPRLFRLRDDKAIINRMGFNNAGAWEAAKSLERLLPLPVPVGISVGKNADCSMEDAPKNYLETLKVMYEFGDYFAVNISSPNTLQLRSLHGGDKLRRLLEPMLDFAAGQKRTKPFFVKIAPDLDDAGLEGAAALAVEKGFGLIATNTTVSRSSVPVYWSGYEGGLSGRPLRELSNAVLAKTAALVKGRVPVIGSGGVFDGPTALEKLKLGADLVQVYSGLVYEGPFIVKDILEYLHRRGWSPSAR
ncbi:MAG: dihydroorotate dehydrogenase (quinone) [Elusimicrobia bacterium HGW-Elusimicrobia-3]|jgi:dihydroorotate dehydrogenase|nr:MAG: dihydroorotate dehydrogenase (quinone) [Elusimicrobia bacterium HGW-Elusimicrobia-3]